MGGRQRAVTADEPELAGGQTVGAELVCAWLCADKFLLKRNLIWFTGQFCELFLALLKDGNKSSADRNDFPQIHKAHKRQDQNSNVGLKFMPFFFFSTLLS